MNIRKKTTMLCLAATLSAGLLSAGSVYGYDGDVDYSAPYVTLDPKTGKLVTIDPKKDQAAAQQTQHPATAADTSASAATTNTTDTGGTAAAISTQSDVTSAQPRTPDKGVFIAIAAIAIIGVFVAIIRRKPVVSTDNSNV